MQFALYEMARNPDIQQRVRDEIEEVLAKHNGEVTYESVSEMNYLGRVIDGKFSFSNSNEQFSESADLFSLLSLY